MLDAAIVAVPILFCLAAALDWHDRRRGHVRRPVRDMLADRRDLERDMAATQHQGIAVPIDGVCRDRQRGR